MYISAAGNGCSNGLHVGLVNQDVLNVFAEFTNIILWKAPTALQLFDPLINIHF